MGGQPHRQHRHQFGQVVRGGASRVGRQRGVRSIAIRAGDFLGDAGTWVDLAMAKGLAKGRFTQMGPADLPHAWA